MKLLLSAPLLLLLLGLARCQFEDEALDDPHPDLENLVDIDDRAQPLTDARDDGLKTTYISGVERLLRGLLKPLTLLAPTASPDSARGVGQKVFNVVTKPIKTVGRAMRGSFSQVLNLIGSKFKAIYPGTEWCGAGNVSKSIDEVGLFKRSDACCREHDMCNANMNAGEAEHGLMNNGAFTRSHCSCDSKFYQCLKEARSLIASNIGYTYFNVLRPQCFREDYPASCAKYGRNRFISNKCVEYKFDTTQNQTWQWFDNPDFL